MKNLYLTYLLCAFAHMNCNTPAKSNENTSATSAPMNAELLETHWKLVELNGQAVTNPAGNQKEAYIMLTKEGNRLQGSGGCNSLMGSYELKEGNQIKFSGVAMTRMACPDMAMETQLGLVFDAVDNYAINGKFLMLHKAKMAPLAKFEAQ
jgi:heat shock protein HslJ